MWEAHPFTIASAGAEEEGEPLRLFVKRVERGWTERLYGFACDGGYDYGTGEDKRRSGGVLGGGRKCRVLIDGPYGSSLLFSPSRRSTRLSLKRSLTPLPFFFAGGTGHTLLSSFSSLLLISGGSGITFSLAQALSLQSKALLGLVRARSIDLVWIVQSAASLKAFMPYLAPLLTNSNSPALKPFHLPFAPTSYKALKITLHIFITRPSAEFTYNSHPSSFLPPTHDRLHIHTGRPNLHTIVNAKIDEATKEARRFVRNHGGRGGVEVNPCGVGIGVCGPRGLGRSLKNVVGGLEGKRMSVVGGVEVVEETFGV